eukprot:TRINITY_DN3410_c0_g1_i1.p1 TRINITY_DN3410_c0_g1~~TRINITY_DN3410_c0_g1_i1.p1  ORF type:complete len:188 (+),score=28.96 TRINITY_DN3410_c0_g1_i1:55-564(+)
MHMSVLVVVAALFFAFVAAQQPVILTWNIGVAYPNTVVTPGTTVVWSTTDDFPHDVTFDSPRNEVQTITPAWMSEGGVAVARNLTFVTPGAWPYHCSVHPRTMTGTVIVQAADTTTTTTGATSAATVTTTGPTSAATVTTTRSSTTTSSANTIMVSMVVAFASLFVLFM